MQNCAREAPTFGLSQTTVNVARSTSTVYYFLFTVVMGRCHAAMSCARCRVIAKLGLSGTGLSHD